MPCNELNVHLKPAAITDAPALFPIFSDATTVQFTNFKNFKEEGNFEQFLQRFLAIEKGSPIQYGPFCICLNDVVIGLCGLQQINIDTGTSELWYLLHPQYWGKGLAKQAVAALLTMSQHNPLLKTVYAEAVTSNTASWRILVNAGFKKTGEKLGGFTKDTIVANLGIYELSCPQS